MKQPEDSKTMELPLAKRGRGRPKLENALSQAERAKRYRDNKRANKSDDTSVTQNAAPNHVSMMATDQANELEKRVHELAQQLRQAHQTIDALRKEQTLLVQERTKAYQHYDQLKEASREAIERNQQLIEQATIMSHAMETMRETIARRDKTIKQLRDAAKRHA